MIDKRIIILGSLLLFVFVGSSYSQNEGARNKGIRTTIVVSRQNILPYESLSVMLLVSNESREDKRIVAPWCSFLNIGETSTAGTKWRSYRADNEPFQKPCVPSATNLAPKESKILRTHIDYEAPSGQHVFVHPGEYLLKGGTTDNGGFMSDEIKITVRVPEGIDGKAYEFLRTTDIHHFFGEYTINKYDYDQKTVEDLEKFISDFDGSEYSYLARMGLAFMWLRGVEGKQDKSKAIDLLSQIANHASDSLSSAAEYHLGRIFYNSDHKVSQANYHFQRVLAGTPSTYFRYLAEEALRPR